MATAGTTDSDRARRFPVGRVLAIVAVLGMTAFWIWALSGAPARDNPDYLRDRAWVARATTRCERMVSRIDALSPARTARTPAERAVTVRAANGELDELVRSLRADRADHAGDRRVITLWLDDWDRYLEARADYAMRLEASDGDDRPRFLLPENPRGDGIDAVITTFADVNDMPACAPPGDVG